MTVPFSDDELMQAFVEYQLVLPELGQGSYKVAYRGRSGSDDIVIKIVKEPLPDEDFDSDDSIPFPTRFGREIEGMSQVNSPYVVKLVEPQENAGFQSATTFGTRSHTIQGGRLRRPSRRPAETRSCLDV